MNLVLVTPPSLEPVTLTDVKIHCDIVRTDQDAMLTTFIAAARKVAELLQRRALLTSTWEVSFEACDVRSVVRLPKAPLQSVVSITYRDQAGSLQTLDSSAYEVVTGTPGRVYARDGAGWPAFASEPGAMTVRFVAGYATPDDVPASTKLGMLLLIGHWYEHREAASELQGVGEIPWGARALFDGDRSGSWQ